MADGHSTSHPEPPKNASRPKTVGVYSEEESTRGTAKKPIGVYERPERSLGWRSPALMIVLAIAAIIALFFILRLLIL
jgi:hypothetical protein